MLDVEVTQTLRRLQRGGPIDQAVAELGRDELGQLGVRVYVSLAEATLVTPRAPRAPRSQARRHRADRLTAQLE